MDVVRLERLCGMLIETAKERGGGDNITCALVYLNGRDQGTGIGDQRAKTVLA